MNWIKKIYREMECSVVGHQLHSESTINDYGYITIYHHLITCSNCGKFFHYDSRFVENKEPEPEIRCGTTT